MAPRVGEGNEHFDFVFAFFSFDFHLFLLLLLLLMLLLLLLLLLVFLLLYADFGGANTVDNGVTLTKNTGFDIIGHCFFASEDGVEENNTLSYNFAGHIHPLGPFWQPAYDVTLGSFSTGTMVDLMD
jgi:hypothetical protein